MRAERGSGGVPAVADGWGWVEAGQSGVEWGGGCHSSDGNILLGIMRETVAGVPTVKSEATLETVLVAKRLAA